jgi:hypothetical protein
VVKLVSARRKEHTAATIDAACQKALKAGARRLKDIKRLLGEPTQQESFAFAHHHPLIRNLRTYSEFIRSAHRPHYDQQHPQKIRVETAGFTQVGTKVPKTRLA